MAMSIWLNYFKEDQTQPIDIGTSSASYMIVLGDKLTSLFGQFLIAA